MVLTDLPGRLSMTKLNGEALKTCHINNFFFQQLFFLHLYIRERLKFNEDTLFYSTHQL